MSTMGGSGYTSLFDPNGPSRFARALGQVKTEMGGVVGSFVALQQKSDSALSSISKNFDALIGKATQYNQTLGQTGAPAAPGGTATTPAGSSGWVPGAPGTANTGGVGGQQGNTLGVGGSGNEPASQTATQTNAPVGGTQDPPRRFSFEPGTPSGAAMAMGSAAIGAAQKFVGASMPVAMSASMVAQQAQTMYGASNAAVSNNIYRLPRNVGILGAYGQQDYLGAISTEMSMTPFPNGGQTNQGFLGWGGNRQSSYSQQWQMLQAQSRFLMRGGATATQAMGALAGLQTGTAENAALNMGIDLAPGGKLKPLIGGPGSIAGQVLQKVSHLGRPFSAEGMAGNLLPGGQIAQVLKQIGIDQSSPEWSTLQQYFMAQAQGGAGQQWLQKHPGQQLPTDPDQLAKALGMDKGAFQQNLSTASKQAQKDSNATEGLAAASKTLDTAASKLLDWTNTVVRGTHTGGIGGFLGGVLGKLGPSGQAIVPFVTEGLSLAKGMGAPGGGNSTGGPRMAVAPVGGGGAGGNSTGGPRATSPTAPSAQSAPVVTSATQSTPLQTATLVAQMLGSGTTAAGGMDWYGTLGRIQPGNAPFFDAAAKGGASTGSAATGTAPGATATGGAASATGPPVPAGGDYTPTTWANALLTALGAPTSAPNVASLVKWEAREGGHWNNPDKYNPLNTTQDAPGARSTNGPGVKAYTSWQQGLTATVQTMTNGYYNDIVAAFKAGTGLGSGHYPSLLKWSGGAYDHIARGSYNIERTKLALVHKGERVIPAAENYSATGRYQRLSADSPGGGTGTTHVHLAFHPGAIQLNVPKGATPNDMNDIAMQFVQAVSKPQILAQVRSS